MTPYWINIYLFRSPPAPYEDTAEVLSSEHKAIEGLAQSIDEGYECCYIHTIAVVGEQLATLLDLRPAAREVLTRWRADEKQKRGEQMAQRL